MQIVDDTLNWIVWIIVPRIVNQVGECREDRTPSQATNVDELRDRSNVPGMRNRKENQWKSGKNDKTAYVKLLSGVQV